jgi:hypothetical protein
MNPIEAVEILQGNGANRYTHYCSGPRRVVRFGIRRFALLDVYPVLLAWSSQIIPQIRSVTPRSMTCRGVEPSKSGLVCLGHSPMALVSTSCDCASKRRVTSPRRFCAAPLGVRPLAQCATRRGEKPANLVKESCGVGYYSFAYGVGPCAGGAGTMASLGVSPNLRSKSRQANILSIECTGSFGLDVCAREQKRKDGAKRIPPRRTAVEASRSRDPDGSAGRIESSMAPAVTSASGMERALVTALSEDLLPRQVFVGRVDGLPGLRLKACRSSGLPRRIRFGI